MDSKEFVVFARRLKMLYPRFAEYAAGLDAETRRSWSAEWEQALADTSFNDAMDALTEIHTGEADGFNPWEFGTWLSTIRKLANAKRRDREAADRSRQPKSYEEPARQSFGLGGIYRQILQAIDAGGDGRKELERLLPVDERSGPRYSCGRCQDTGFVTAWHFVTMRAVERGEELTTRNLKTMTTLCNCERGREKITPANAKRVYWTDGHVFDSARHCECRHGDTRSASNVAELREFVDRLAQQQLESRHNYSPALAAFGAL